MSITGEAEGEPVKVGVAWIDIITGLYAGNAILAALLDRERTGTIRHIDVSLWDCAVASLANQAQNVLASGIDPSRMGSAHPNLVPYRAFEAKDGWFVVAVGSDTQWCKHDALVYVVSWNSIVRRAMNLPRFQARMVENAEAYVILRRPIGIDGNHSYYWRSRIRWQYIFSNCNGERSFNPYC